MKYRRDSTAIGASACHHQKDSVNRISAPLGIFAQFDSSNRRETQIGLSGRMSAEEILITGDSDLDNSRGDVIVSPVANCFAAEFRLGIDLHFLFAAFLRWM
jgi:hypothetical protein